MLCTEEEGDMRLGSSKFRLSEELALLSSTSEDGISILYAPVTVNSKPLECPGIELSYSSYESHFCSALTEGW